MIAKIEKSKAFGCVSAPPSKSMAHRYLICAALSKYKSQICGVDFSKDIKATLGCLKALGADIQIEGDDVKIGGIDTNGDIYSNTLFCDESGSTLRFLIPISLLFDKEILLTGSERLFKRSLSVYEKLCREQKIPFVQKENQVLLKGRLLSGKYSVKGDISSQFISGLMFALPLLEKDSEIQIEGALESGSYLGLTIKALADFGVRASRADEHTIYIKGNQTYKKRKLRVEGDYSNAAFFDAFNYIGGNVLVKGLDEASVQGDRVYKEIFPLLTKGTPTVDISDCPDLGPVLMALAAANNGAVFTGTHRLKIKESDRGTAMAAELKKFGCNVLVEENKITVEKCCLKTPQVPLLSHNDHRIVMSLSILATLTGGEIYGCEAVAKSFPDFFEKLKEIGICVTTNEID